MDGRRVNWIYLFHGEDELSSHEAVQGLVARMKESPVWEYNVVYFEGERVALSDLAATCQTVPFLGDKRLVVVTNLLSHLSDQGRGPGRDEVRSDRPSRGGKRDLLRGLLQFLPAVPEFCRLVFLEGQLIPERDQVLQAVRELGGFVKAHRLDESNLLVWIRDRARKIGCKMSGEAAEELAAAVGPNSRLLHGEMVKLATYCQDRAVTADDVRKLVVDARKANVFAMVDALGLRQPEAALREFRKLLSEGDHPLRVMAMVVRQFRLLIQVKELTQAGASPDEMARKTGAPPRGVASLQRQARNFTFDQLEQAYRRLLECDLQVKNGSMEPESAVELAIVELVRAA